jgi:protein arginine N-methyltransferase 1
VSRVIDEHRRYLRDAHRLEAFSRAIAATVRPGDRVIDLGSGTGVLGLLACRAGARVVFAIEATGIVGLASDVRDRNGFRDRMVFVRGFSTDVSLPERADVIVSDQIGRFGFDGNILRFFEDARKRLLRPEARYIPSALELHVAPVEDCRMYERIEFWDTQPGGFDFRPVRGPAANTIYPARFRADSLLGSAALGLRLDLGLETSRRLAFAASLPIERIGVLHGLGGWFHAQMADGVRMSNSPIDPARIRRRQVFMPIGRAIEVATGDRVDARIQVLPEHHVVTWEVRVERRGGHSDLFRHSTLHGMLVTPEELDRTRPGFRPSLTAAGAARRSILELCDGSRTLADIEDEVFRRHGDLFPTRDQAAVFVAEVVTRYARDAGRQGDG